MSATLIRVNIAGYSGQAVTLFGAYDHINDMLLVNSDTDYNQADDEKFLKVTNQERDPYRDLLVSDDDLNDAINAFFEMEGMKLLHMEERVKRFNPASKIERDGVDAVGVRYRISPDITNGQLAVMYCCLAAVRQRAVADSIELMGEFSAFSV